MSWRLPRHFQALSGALAVEDDCVDHSQVIPKRMTDAASEMSPLVVLRDYYWVVPTLPDYEEGGDAAVADGCESHVE